MNGYFRLIHEANRTSLKLIPPAGNDKPIDINDIIEYMTMKGYSCDLPDLKRAVDAASDKEVVFALAQGKRTPERECCKLTITPDKMQVYARFYAASEGGEKISAGEILRELESKGVKSGIKKDVIAQFIQSRKYCEDILLAEGTQPTRGKDAFIEYKFNTDKKAKPTLKEDGSVDFFNLNILNHCSKGDILAILHKEEAGVAGEDVFGTHIKPADVKTAKLKFGNNIELSEDGMTLTSLVDGHVELIDEEVFVSDMLIVENVDNSTGDIDYEGSVQVNGNVSTNFTVKAQGDIVVKGVVEGAVLQSSGNIIIARGMNGKGKGSLTAKGNIVAKFLENSTAQADGYIASESILHSKITAGTEINVDGRRGFITGGRVCAANAINVKTLGSEMGADTIVEVGADPTIKNRIAQLQKLIDEDTKTLQTIQPVLIAAKQKITQGIKLSQDQLKHIHALTIANQQKSEAIRENESELRVLTDQTGDIAQAQVKVKGMVYPGTKICIGDVSMVVQKNAHYCRFVRERGDVKMAPF
ncbi:MAG: FapA family protein [Lachnospiraceae bacterium]|nr:FapA family protein [Lachnospiraceae bacterium]